MAAPGDPTDAEQRPNMWEELNRPKGAHHRSAHLPPPPPAVTASTDVSTTPDTSPAGDKIDPEHLLLAGGVLFLIVTFFALSGIGGSNSTAETAPEPDALAVIDNVTSDNVTSDNVTNDSASSNSAEPTTTEPTATTQTSTTAAVAEPMAMGLPASLLDSEQSQVFRLYQTALGREPDRGGFAFWSDQVRSGVPLEQLANEFLASDEYQSQFADGMEWDNRADLLLTNAFGQADNSAELDEWRQRFVGLSGAELLLAISEADETLVATGTLR